MRNLGLDPDLMMMRIEDVIIKTIISIEDKLYKASEKYVPFRNNCFQLLGFDILIDSKLNPWLIEVTKNQPVHSSPTTNAPKLTKSTQKLIFV